jgi:hypothetical protein
MFMKLTQRRYIQSKQKELKSFGPTIVYLSNFFDFALGILILLGEAGRVEFLDGIGRELDRVHSDITHRKAWAELLKQA